MRRVTVRAVGLVGVGLWTGAGMFGPAQAASFDCAKAKAPIEILICTTPAVNALDDRLKVALDAAVNRAGDGRAALLADHKRWLAEFPKACGVTPSPVAPAVVTCVAAAYEQQLVQLAPAVASAPAGPTPPVAPTQPVPGPVVTLDQAQLPASGTQSTYFSVEGPGRVTVRAESATGVALRLVDMIAGPLADAGEPGERDGRIDALLDRGRYKLILTGAEKATGTVSLTVSSAAELNQPPPVLAHDSGQTLSARLADGEQRSYWLTVGDDPVTLVAAGRALADMRLWRDGIELTDIQPRLRLVDIEPGKSQRILTIAGKIEPGRYRLTVYGGAPLRWPEAGAEMPLSVRLGLPKLAGLDQRKGILGPTGIEQFIVPPPVDFVRLELANVAPVRLSAVPLQAGRGADWGTSAEISKLSRRPVASVAFTPGAQGTLISIEGAPGLPYSLSQFQLAAPGDSQLTRASTERLLTLLDTGTEGANFPLTALLYRGNEVFAGSYPELTAQTALRYRLTLDGRNTLLFRVIDSGLVRLKIEGVPHFWSVVPVLGSDPIPSEKGGLLDLEAGLYQLNLRPSSALTGPVDVVLAGENADLTVPGSAAAPKAAHPLSFTVPPTPPNSYNYPRLYLAERAESPVGFALYDLPLKLTDGAPVVFALAAEQAINLPIETSGAGSLTVLDDADKPVAFTVDGKAIPLKAPVMAGSYKLELKNTGKTARHFRLRFESPARAAVSAPPVAEPVLVSNPRLTAGQTYAGDFRSGAPRRFDLLVEEPGLYRVETLGRLAMSTRLKTRLLPLLAEAAQNGIGHNAVMERYLRAGLYQLDVMSLDGTQGRAQLALSRAPLTEGETLQIDQPARVGLARGTGAILPFTVAQAGRYTLNVLSLAQSIGFRLEDADGWPILPRAHQPEPFGEAGSKLTVALAAGGYRLVLLPPALATRALVRLTPELGESLPPQGHGPHPLVLNSVQDFRWVEPDQPDQPRVPDQWDFALPGPTRLTLGLTDGMVGQLQRADSRGWTAVGAVSNAVPFDQTVAGGRYRLSLTALARNNRLGYRLTSATEQLLPDQPRLVTLPTRQSFTLDAPQTVRLASFGTKDVKAVLRDADNRIIVQADDRQNDWNFVIVRALAAGSYSLSVEPVTPPPAGVAEGEASTAPEYTGEGESYEGEGEGEVSEEREEPSAPTPDPGLTPLERLAAGAVELSLTYLPETIAAPVALTVGKAETRTMAGAQNLLPLTLAAGQGLTLVEADLGSELLLSLERQGAVGGAWETLAQASGPAPRLAFVPGAEAYRLRAVTLGAVAAGGRGVTLRQIDPPAQALGEPLNFASLEGATVAVARLTVPGAAAVDLGSPAPDLLSVSGVAGVGKAVAGAQLLPEGADVWLVRAPTATQVLTPRLLAPAPDAPLVLRLNGNATLAVPPVPEGRVQLWQAEAPQGQPFLAVGGGAGLAPGSAVALGGDPKLRIGAVGSTPMPLVTLTRHLLTSPGQTEVRHAAITLTLDPRSSRDLRLPAGLKRLTLDLPAGVVGDPADGGPLLWSAGQPLSRQLETRSERLRLFNLSTTPAAIALRQMPIPAGRLLVGPQVSFKQFLGAAGSLSLAIQGQPGQVLIVDGAVGAAVWQGKDGSVSRGKRLPIHGPGVLSLDHPAGLLAVWLEGPGAGFWPALKTQTLQLPNSLSLSGAAQAVRLTLTEPSLLHLRSTAPLIAGLRVPGEAEAIRLFPNGVDWHRYVPAGEVELRLAAPQDGALSGTLELQASPVTRIGDGLSAPVPLAAGDTRAFAFTVPRAGKIGVGVRSARDPVSVRLLDAGGRVLGAGLVQYKTVPAGDYVLEVQAPSDAALSLQAAVVGIAAPNRGPPPDVQQSYLELVGLRSNAP